MRFPNCNMEMLVAVVATAESKTKAQAAEKLSITVSALDKRLKTAADLLRAPLFRHGSVVQPTEEGRIFYRSALRSIEFASLAEQSTLAYVSLNANRILIGHSSELAPRVLQMIRTLKLGGTKVGSLEHRPGVTPGIVGSVVDGSLHAGFGFLPLTVPELLIRTVFEEPLVVCIPASHPLARRPVIQAEDLNNESSVAVARDTFPVLYEEIKEYFDSVGITMPIAADALTPAEALLLVEQGVGLTFLAKSSATNHRGIVFRPLWTKILMRRTAFFVRNDNRNSLIEELTGSVIEAANDLNRR